MAPDHGHWAGHSVSTAKIRAIRPQLIQVDEKTDGPGLADHKRLIGLLELKPLTIGHPAVRNRRKKSNFDSLAVAVRKDGPKSLEDYSLKPIVTSRNRLSDLVGLRGAPCPKHSPRSFWIIQRRAGRDAYKRYAQQFFTDLPFLFATANLDWIRIVDEDATAGKVEKKWAKEQMSVTVADLMQAQATMPFLGLLGICEYDMSRLTHT